MVFTCDTSILTNHNDYSKFTNPTRETYQILTQQQHHYLTVQAQDSADAIACSPTTLTKLVKWYQILKINLFYV
jgi:hypothetical protein